MAVRLHTSGRVGGRLALCAVVALSLIGAAAPVSATGLRAGDAVLAQSDAGTDPETGADAPQPTVSAPVVELDRYSLRIGDEITITVAGFTRRGVTATVCGNDALRGSVDCNLAGAEGIEIEGNGVPDSQIMTVVEPPQPCPCIIRVASSDNSEVAYVDITLVGHPTAPPVTSERRTLEPLAVGVSAEPIGRSGLGWISASLGGSLEYEVTVTITNGSNVDASGVSIAASVGRGLDDVIGLLDLPAPGVIARGQTWSQSVRAELPAPTYGTYVWRVDVTGDRPTVQATDTTSHLPGLLVVGLLVLVVDLVVLMIRWIIRRRRSSDDGGDGGSHVDDVPAGPVIDLGPVFDDDRERTLQLS